MEITIKGEPKEIAALVLGVQERQTTQEGITFQSPTFTCECSEKLDLQKMNDQINRQLGEHGLYA
ncbi:MAG: hypothetical protein FWC60_09765 [Firmicutes bacterium]|nr:hypothetical protein [Bacillota bacterium]